MWLPLSFLHLFLICTVQNSMPEDIDSLLPYTKHHGPVHRRQQFCQDHRFGNTTYSLHRGHVNLLDLSHVVDIYHKVATVGEYYSMQNNVVLRYQRVYNPKQTFSVLEPKHRGTCRGNFGITATVQQTARNNCILATNAGFFDIQTGQCLGHVVSDGRLVQDSGGIQNVHFGITLQGELFTGYLSEYQLVTMQFKQLIGGVIWLLRDGELYVNQSRDIECPDTTGKGPLDQFIDVMSARTAVGHDTEGRILMAQVDGKTDKYGVNLWEFASLLKEIGFVNAINLDGGGSTTSIFNGSLINYPSDSCPNSTRNCARKVSTILCVHQAECLPHPYCYNRGDCTTGQCHCRLPWSGKSCQLPTCHAACSGHGQCLKGSYSEKMDGISSSPLLKWLVAGLHQLLRFAFLLPIL